MEKQYLSVSLLTRYIKQKFDRDPYLERVFLRGEISNYNRNRPNGHKYFSMKDEEAKINAVMFQSVTRNLRFTPEEGMQVLVVWRVTSYEKTGVYQMIIEHMEPDGIGQLYQALEETKKKLRLEGLFDTPKQELVKYPKKIAVITSPSGAVIRDLITTVKRRYPIVEWVLYPTLVQGDRAADSIVKNIERANEDGTYDTIIMGRGGGSIEDLWPFNEERVARAIFASNIPVISSVGHETDTTVADLVADVRAATPTAAAELAVPVLSDELLKIEQMRLRLNYLFRNYLETNNEKLNRLTSSYVFRQPQRLYESYVQNVDQLKQALDRLMQTTIVEKKQTLQMNSLQLQANHPKKLVKEKKDAHALLDENLYKEMKQYMEQKEKDFMYTVQSLDYLSPMKIMNRGYSYVTNPEGKVVKDVLQVKVGDTIDIHLHQGHLQAEITKKEQTKND